MLNLLSRIRVVLVEPTHPGNIGAVARSMKTMGLGRLVMVKPKKFPHYEATKRSAGAESVLDDAVVVDDIDQALAGCTLVLGTSVRDREVSWPTFDPRVSADKVMNHLGINDLDQMSLEFDGAESAAEGSQPQVAILFGRESSGLTNQEMDLCHSQIRISANDEYSSLNLASAVQIIAYELRMRAIESTDSDVSKSAQAQTPLQDRQQLATVEQQQGYINHLQKTLEAIDFIKTKPPTMLMRKLTRLYNKSELTVDEILILLGISSAIDDKLN